MVLLIMSLPINLDCQKMHPSFPQKMTIRLIFDLFSWNIHHNELFSSFPVLWKDIYNFFSSIYRLIDFLASTDCNAKTNSIEHNVTIVLSPFLFLWQQSRVQCKIKNAKNMNTSDITITRYFNIQMVKNTNEYAHKDELSKHAQRTLPIRKQCMGG